VPGKGIVMCAHNATNKLPPTTRRLAARLQKRPFLLNA
jgi:hypothetical protein